MDKTTTLAALDTMRSSANETNDCAPRAISIASGCTYEQALWLCAKYGKRKPRRGTKTADVMTAIMDNDMVVGARRFRWVQRPRDLRNRRFKTVGKFAAANPTGRFVLRVSGHAVAVVNGVVMDYFDYGKQDRRRISWIAESY